MANNQSTMCAGLPKGLWWLLTLLGLGLLYFLMLSSRQGPIEAELTDRTTAGLAAENIDWANVELNRHGRDVRLTGVAPSEDARNQALKIAGDVSGVRVVHHNIEVAEPVVVPPVAVVIPEPEPEPIPEPEPAPDPVDTHLAMCQAKLDSTMAGKKVLFAYNKAEVHVDSYGLLQQMAAVINECKDIVTASGLTISGHTDSRGDDAYNMALSDKRAAAVKASLAAAGVDVGLMSSVGHGESQPVASNDTEEGMAQNRRINFTIKHK